MLDRVIDVIEEEIARLTDLKKQLSLDQEKTRNKRKNGSTIIKSVIVDQTMLTGLVD